MSGHAAQAGGAPRAQLAPDYSVSRLIKGGWQLAGGHGPVDDTTALEAMAAFADAGITTFDCADIYTGVEALIGRFLRTQAEPSRIQVHTKYVPDLASLGTLRAADVGAAVARSLDRLGVGRLDLVQFHWWDLDAPGLLDTVGWLDAERQRGRLRHVGLTNMDTPTLAAILDRDIPVLSHQVQYSVLDQRPAGAMHDLCARHGVTFLCYGTLAGGFLDERYLGAPDPPAITNRSLIKYRLVIDECGGWPRFQDLLQVLAGVARRHEVALGAVAVAWVLEQPGVAAAIVGARDARRLGDTLAAARLRLDDGDRRAIRAWIDAGPTMPGDVYTLERDRGGRHGAIMKYDLNTRSAASG